MTTGLAPTFLLIGSPKAGSTSLFRYLDLHPDVFRSTFKEPRFFALEGRPPPALADGRRMVDTWDDYLALFADARPDQARGEGSVGYLHSAGVLERVHARVPEVRLLVILRHPVEAVWSQYLMAVRDGEETRPIEVMIDQEPLEPRSPPWEPNHDDLVRMRFYHHHLARWLAEFPAEQLLVLLYEDLLADAETVVRRAWAHIGVDPDVPLDVSERHNVGSDPRSLRLHRFTERPGSVGRAVKDALRHVPGRPAVQRLVQGWNERPVPPVPWAVRRRLLTIYGEDTAALQELLGRDLSAWMR